MNTLNDKKFTEINYTDGWEVLTNNGFEEFQGVGKTIEYQCYEVNFDDGNSIIGADTHIFIKSDHTNVFLKDLKIGEEIISSSGTSKVVSVKDLKRKAAMYDLIGVENQKYFTNDILSHNTTTTTIYICHYILFNRNKTICIYSYKLGEAKKILNDLKNAYQQLPKWMQIGVVEWNKMSITLENGMCVKVFSTNEESGRGNTAAITLIDEAARIKTKKWIPFFKAVTGTGSSAGLDKSKTGKIIMLSTANGMNHFYKMYIDAFKGSSDYKPIRVDWYNVENRANPTLKFEYLKPNTKIKLKRIEDGKLFTKTVKKLYEELEKKENNIKQNIYYFKYDGKYIPFYRAHLHNYQTEELYDMIHYDFYYQEMKINGNDEANFDQEHGNCFLGSGDMLLSPESYSKLTIEDPIDPNEIPSLYRMFDNISTILRPHIQIYEKVKKNHKYMIGVDGATITTTKNDETNAKNGDNASIQVIDITKKPIKQVAN